MPKMTMIGMMILSSTFFIYSRTFPNKKYIVAVTIRTNWIWGRDT